MKNKLTRILVLMLALAVMLCFAACNSTTPPDNENEGTGGEGGNGEGGSGEGEGGSTESEIDWDNVPLDGMPLIYNKVARFQVVYTVEGAAAAVRAAEDLVAELRDFGIEIGDAVSDKDAADVKDCEIIIGTGVRHRGDEANVSARYLGESGYTGKIVGERIILAGGTPTLTKDVFNSFVKDQLGITNKTRELGDVAIDADYFLEVLTEYGISTITIGGVDLSEFTVVTDLDGMANFSTETILKFREDIYDASGYWLNEGKLEDMDSYEHKIVIRYSPTINEKYRDDGFAAYVDEGDLIIECSYANAFDSAYKTFITKEITDKMNSVKLSSTYSYTKCVSKVYYKDFGAVGDGETDDYEAMYKAHVYANQCGQTVCADGDDAVYYVHIFHNGDIPVKTDVCLGNSKIIINDTGSQVYAKRGQHLYRLVKDNDGVSYSEDKIKNMFGDVKLSVGQTKIDWLAPYLETDSLVRFINKYHKDFVRNGANEDAGYNRMDVVMVDADGNVDPETPIIFEFDKITEIRIIRADDAPITFDGGYFETICCTVVPETEMKNIYHSYGRGICVYRANATVQNVTHRMVKEPVVDGTKRSESYPYHAFLVFDQTYNAKTIDLDLTGHTTYAAHENGVSMGSYDFVIMYSIGVEFYGLEQNGVDIKDQKYWGIMASNGVKNIKFVDCEMSRFDAHRGFYNGELTNCTIGFAFNVIGGGLLKATNVTKSTGAEFISLRGDYGATFEGDMELVNCNLAGYKGYNSSRGVFTAEKLTTGLILKCDFASTSDDEAYQEYLNWNFGYTCYMPQNILLDNFQYGTSELYVFNKIGRGDDVFSPDIANTYMITQNITFRNMQNLPLVQDPTVYTKLSSIPVVNETKTED